MTEGLRFGHGGEAGTSAGAHARDDPNAAENEAANRVSYPGQLRVLFLAGLLLLVAGLVSSLFAASAAPILIAMTGALLLLASLTQAEHVYTAALRHDARSW